MRDEDHIVARVVGLTHRYGNTRAIDNVDLAIPAGCMAGLIGPDGVGKSSLLALIAGARKIQTGSVEVLGGDMGHGRYRIATSPRIAYMPQGLGKNLYATLSVFENVDFFGRLFGQSRAEREERIEDLFKSTGLARFRHRPAAKLSGGMKQKLGLCCALIHDPDLLILDEPTTGVDPLSRRQFWELIDRLRARRAGMSVVVATAYMEEAERFDWLVAMNDGRVLATGSPVELKTRTGAASLDDAFIQLLPEAQRVGHRAVAARARTAAPGGAPAIEAESLTMRFGDFTAVDRVSFRIERGEIFGFLGSNGCGKTTTMKMLTGLLPPSAGNAKLFGSPFDPHDLATRKRVGYMTQAFSLYEELTVRQNLVLHARLFHLPHKQVMPRVHELIERFGLGDYRDALASALPLGIRQRLSLAVAMVHRPEILILDEPTSGVDPVARDRFWELLLDISRKQGVTLFISTHFMNEAERCDRISLMHAGKVLASGTPAALKRVRGAPTLEETFIAYLEEAVGKDTDDTAADPVPPPVSNALHHTGVFRLPRLLGVARRETLELWHDPIRLTFALLGSALLMVMLGYGMTFDVEELRFAALDRDQTPASRDYLSNIAGSRYFVERAPLRDHLELDRRMRSGELSLAIEIPPSFGRDLKRDRAPEVGVWVDGVMPFRGETVRGYVQGLHYHYLSHLSVHTGDVASRRAAVADIEVRYRYNQDFESFNAMVPGTIAILLVFIPAMLMALGVVREKELGSITNLYVTPLTRLEFLLGKQLPYISLSMLSFFGLVVMAVFAFGVALKGSVLALTVGALLYVTATTGLGLLMSTFTRSQVAAIFGTAIATTLPAIQFSGLTSPVSSLEGGAAVISQLYPMTYFLVIIRGTFSKALGLGDLYGQLAALAAFIPALTVVSVLLLRTGEVTVRRLANVLQLGVKELRSLWYDKVLFVFLIWAFFFGIYDAATGHSTELRNAPIAVVDEDRSPLSQRIIGAFHAPRFLVPELISFADVDPGLDAGRYTFTLHVPAGFQRDVLAGHRPAIQLNVDATRMDQAFIGSGYINNIATDEITRFVQGHRGEAGLPIGLAVRVQFNPNLNGTWFGGVMEIVNNITMLSVILAGAALIREREHGTIEHLLVMPLTPFQIMMAKVWANGLVVLVAAGLSLGLVIQGALGMPIAGSVPLFLFAALLHLFSTTAMGILLATVARSMPQFALLMILVVLPLQMLSGGNTPRESMPEFVQAIMLAAPTTHFVSLAQAVLFRGAGLTVVWPHLLAIVAIGAVFFAVALARFRKSITLTQL